jgi:CBS domain-containing protein
MALTLQRGVVLKTSALFLLVEPGHGPSLDGPGSMAYAPCGELEACLESHRVKSIMLPYETGVSLKFSVEPEDRLAHAVERMLLYNATRIAVVENGSVVGMIHLGDALKKLGLETS